MGSQGAGLNTFSRWKDFHILKATQKALFEKVKVKILGPCYILENKKLLQKTRDRPCSNKSHFLKAQVPCIQDFHIDTWLFSQKKVLLSDETFQF
jgi:hypothetical protein